MKFTFDIEETLTRRVVIESDCFGNAIAEINRRMDEEEIVLDSSDFVGGELRMPLDENFLPQLQLCGEDVKNKDDMDIVLDIW